MKLIKSTRCHPPLHRFIALIAMSLLSSSLPAQEAGFMLKDTLNADSMSSSSYTLDRISETRWFKATSIGVPLIVGGLLNKHQDDNYFRHRDDFKPHHSDNVEDYILYLPAAALLGLKASGVPSSSSWGRMLLGDAMSVGIMAIAVQSLKHSSNVTRPDGYDNYSFPSGHTATAFMTATMLTKEYGHLSPWVGVGAYGVATATGLMRISHNKHRLSDVLVGAGIGILSVEAGYWITDLIMKDKGKNSVKHYHMDYGQEPENSFISIHAGFNLPLRSYRVNPTTRFHTSTGSTLALEGAWFWNTYMGIGACASMSKLQYIINDETAPDNTLDFYSVHVGPYFRVPLSHRWSLGSKLTGGMTHYKSIPMGTTTLPARNGWGVATGLSVNFLARQHVEASLMIDYNLMPPCGNMDQYMHMLTPGARLAFRL